MDLHPSLQKYLNLLEIELNAFQEAFIKSNKAENLLLVAPTGMGKTLAASLLIINDLLNRPNHNKAKNISPLAIWVTPLKALARNLTSQLQGYWNQFWEENSEEIPPESIADRSIADRTGDTSQEDRRQIVKKPPFILCTTPESLFSMVVQKGTRSFMRRVKYIVVDELHSLVESKRGVLLTLVLELVERISIFDHLVRIGLSATIENLEWISKFLVGPKRTCKLFNEERFNRIPELELVLVPRKSKRLPFTGYLASWLAEPIGKEVNINRTILLFTKTRSAAELMGYGLKKHVDEDLKLRIAVHHSSLSQEERYFVESGLKHGYLKVVACTGSLELGIDIGHIDEVLLLGSANSTNTALQRLGRARHNPDETSIGKLFVVNFFDLLVAISLKRSMLEKKLSPVKAIEKPLEVLAQFIFGLAIQQSFRLEELKSILSKTLLFSSISDRELDNVLTYCIQGGASLYAYEEYKRLRFEDGIYSINSTQFKRLFYQNIGTIVEEDMVPVYSARGRRIGGLTEELAKNLAIGDFLSISGKTYKLVGYKESHLIVQRASGKKPTIPRWGKERLNLSTEVFDSLMKLYNEIDSSNGIISSEYWLSEDIRKTIKQVYDLQLSSAPWPTTNHVQIEFYDLRTIPIRSRSIRGVRASHPFLVVIYTFAGYKQNQTLARLVAYRLQQYRIFQVRIHTDELAFSLFSYKDFPKDKNSWISLFKRENTEDNLTRILENSSALRIAFRETAIVGQMVLRTYYKMRKTGKQLRLSHDLLFDVLMKYEPSHPLLIAARQQVSKQFLNIPQTINWLTEFNKTAEKLLLLSPENLPVLSLPVIVHGWIDWSMPDSPEELINEFIEKTINNNKIN